VCGRRVLIGGIRSTFEQTSTLVRGSLRAVWKECNFNDPGIVDRHA
jgi:hypothetical protein